MALFRRKNPAPAPSTVAGVAPGGHAGVGGGTGAAGVSGVAAGGGQPASTTAATPAQPTGTGPFDSADVPEVGPRADLGALRIPVVPGMQVRMELDRATQQITGVTVMVQQPAGISSLQLQAFAAPKTAGIWDEIRTEIADGITKSGGKVDDVPGEFGRELIAHITRSGPGGETVRKARFLGHDGPRWFLRGVITGPAAGDPEAAKVLEDVFRNTVVVRDNTPKPPRDLLPLSLPGQAQKLAGPPADAVSDFNPMARGPEIAEVR